MREWHCVAVLLGESGERERSRRRCLPPIAVLTAAAADPDTPPPPRPPKAKAAATHPPLPGFESAGTSGGLADAKAAVARAETALGRGE